MTPEEMREFAEKELPLIRKARKYTYRLLFYAEAVTEAWQEQRKAFDETETSDLNIAKERIAQLESHIAKLNSVCDYACDVAGEVFLSVDEAYKSVVWMHNRITELERDKAGDRQFSQALAERLKLKDLG